MLASLALLVFACSFYEADFVKVVVKAQPLASAVFFARVFKKSECWMVAGGRFRRAEARVAPITYFYPSRITACSCLSETRDLFRAPDFSRAF